MTGEGGNHLNSLVRKCGNPEIRMMNPQNSHGRVNYHQLVMPLWYRNGFVLHEDGLDT